MHPVLFDLGFFSLHSYGALAAVGFLLVVGLSIWRAGRLGIDADTLVNLIFVAAVAGVIGSRGVWVLQNLDRVHSFVDVINIRNGGLVFYGALLLGVPTTLAEMWRRKLPIAAICDVFATALPLGHAISRLGCFFAGCCYGLPTDLPWGITFTHPLVDAPHDIALHPTQLYEMALLLGIGAACNALYARRRFDGQVMLAYLGLYGVARFAVELFRGDISRGYFLEPVLGQTLSMSQGISLVFLSAVALGWVLLSRRGEGPTTAVSTDRGDAR